jgi:hypothetical protein
MRSHMILSRVFQRILSVGAVVLAGALFTVNQPALGATLSTPPVRSAPTPSVRGVVLDSAGIPIADAQVVGAGDGDSYRH